MELADMPGHPARAMAKRHKAAVEEMLAGKLSESGVVHSHDVARQIMLLLEGCLSLVLIHGDAVYVAAGARAAKRLVTTNRQEGA
jgi:hypothetical protein